MVLVSVTVVAVVELGANEIFGALERIIFVCSTSSARVHVCLRFYAVLDLG
uniref:BLTX353 n=1 Tax=Nephila pilipes TaxID=299642 RepID=A0A076KZE7_NEPPI|nr:BLTX353 [Nephila pilipes]